MKFSDRIVTEVPPQINITTNFHLLRQFLKIDRINKEINETQKLKQTLLGWIRSISELKNELRKHLESAKAWQVFLPYSPKIGAQGIKGGRFLKCYNYKSR